MKSVAITGYFATGSGAVYNLLQEYASVTDGGLSDFEHLFLYDTNGVFDTVDKILYSNSLFNSNAAINAFRKEMIRINNTDFNWFGGYRYRYGNRFMDIVEDFIDDICEYHIDRDWYGTFEKRVYSLERIVKDLVKVIIGKRKIDHTFGTKIVMNSFNRGEFSFASQEKLASATKKMVSRYINMMYEDNGKIVILNHMLSPQDAYRIDMFMPDDLKLIIVDRDIRDLYIYNKYLNTWGGNAFPTEQNQFVSFMTQYRSTERYVNSERILRIQFEDLIYKYNETVERIEKFLEIDPKDHVYQNKYLIPEKSIKNTQVFRMNDVWEKEANEVAKSFSKLTYEFPYRINQKESEIFDA